MDDNTQRDSTQHSRTQKAKPQSTRAHNMVPMRTNKDKENPSTEKRKNNQEPHTNRTRAHSPSSDPLCSSLPSTPQVQPSSAEQCSHSHELRPTPPQPIHKRSSERSRSSNDERRSVIHRRRGELRPELDGAAADWRRGRHFQVSVYFEKGNHSTSKVFLSFRVRVGVCLWRRKLTNK